MKRVLMCVAPGGYDDLREKGVLWKIEEREEGGYFDKVVNLSWRARSSRMVRLSRRSSIVEVGSRIRPMGVAFCLLVGVFLCLWHRVTLVRATEPFVSGLLGWVIARSCRRPFCVSIHSDYALSERVTGQSPQKLGRFGKVLARQVLSRADMVMPIRKHLVQYAINQGAPRDRIRVIPHGIGLSAYDIGPFEKYGFFEGKRVVLFVGRLSRENYIDDVVAVAARLPEDAVLLVVGDGPERLRLEAARCENVFFTGFLDRKKVVIIQVRSDVGLCLRGGYTLIEMAAAGLATGAYDVDWHSEIVEDGVTGFLESEGDVSAVGDSVLRLLGDQKLSVRLGRNARLVAAGYSLEAMRKVKVECYEEMLT